MARKRLPKDIALIDARVRQLILRLRRTANELEELNTQRRKLVTGRLKALPPPGVKRPLPEYDDARRSPEFNDEIPL